MNVDVYSCALVTDRVHFEQEMSFAMLQNAIHDINDQIFDAVE